MKRRVLAVMPLISLFVFLLSGLYYGEWAWGAMAFLLIPLSWIMFSSHPWKRLADVMPFVALLVFLWLGFSFDLWHPGWVVFFSIPLVDLIASKRIEMRKIVGISIAVIYVVIGILTEAWHPTWIIFLLIPIINTLFFPQKSFKFINANGIKAKFKDIIIEHEKKDPDDDF